MSSNHLILCRPLLLLPPIPPSIRVFVLLNMISLILLLTSSSFRGWYLVTDTTPAHTVSGIRLAINTCVHFKNKIVLSAKSLQSCPTLCDPMDCSPPDSSILGVLQARVLEWVAVPSSRGSSQHRDGTHLSYVSCIGRQVFFLPLAPPGKPKIVLRARNFWDREEGQGEVCVGSKEIVKGALHQHSLRTFPSPFSLCL